MKNLSAKKPVEEKKKERRKPKNKSQDKLCVDCNLQHSYIVKWFAKKPYLTNPAFVTTEAPVTWPRVPKATLLLK